MSAYYNTTPITGTDLMRAIEVAKTQDEAVMLFFDSGAVWSPSQIWKYGTWTEGKRKWLLTSVRRSISTLTKQGKLKMTGIIVPGPYGRPENTWNRT